METSKRLNENEKRVICQKLSKGAFVRSILMEDLLEADQVRSCLEAKDLRLAISRTTLDQLAIFSELLKKREEKLEVRDVKEYTILHYQFHKALVATSGNQFLMRLHTMVTEQFVTDRLTYTYLKRRARVGEVSHRKIYELLASDETTEASRLIGDHISIMLSDSMDIGAVRPEKGSPRILRNETKAKKS